MVSQENPRRRFLVNAGKTTVLAAVGSGIVLSNTLASDSKVATKEVIRGKSKKVEILYQKTATWEDYYKRAF